MPVVPEPTARVVLVGLILALLAGCASNDQSPPAPTTGVVTATPSSQVDQSAAPSTSSAPQPSTLSPADGFLRFVADSSFRATSTVSGQLTIGTKHQAVSGTYHVVTANFARSLRIGSAKVPTAGFILFVGKAWTNTGSGPWFAAAKPAADSGLPQILRSIRQATDVGVEQKGGRTLHHLTLGATSPVTPTTVGIGDGSITSLAGDLEAWVDEAGTPAVIDAHTTWTQTVAGKATSAGLELEFSLSNINGTVPVNEPDGTWAMATSKRHHYTMARPTYWLYTPDNGKRRYDVFGNGIRGTGVYVMADPAFGDSLATWVGRFRRESPFVNNKGYRVMSSKGTKLAGVTARRLEYRSTFKGKKVSGIMVIAVRKNMLYRIIFEAPYQLGDADRALFDQFLVTFKFK